MNGETPIPVVLCIDAEPDARLVDRRRAAAWTGYEKLHAHVAALRERFAASHGVVLRLSWFLRMDPQVEDTHGKATWAAEHYAGALSEVSRAGDEIGLHVHAYRWDGAAGDWVADHGNPAWIAQCVEASAEAFRSAFGRRCAAYRMGDRYLDEPTLGLMEKLGGRVDLTVEPGYGPSPAVFVEHLHTGSLPDVRTAPRRAYRPSPGDFRIPDASGERAISILPLSTWKIPGLLAAVRRVYVAARVLRKGPLPDTLKRERRMTLGLSLPPVVFRRMLDDLLAAEPATHLASIDRTHVGNDAQKLARIETNLRYLLSHPKARRFVFVRPEEALGPLAAGHEAAPARPSAAAM
jgi:hypothetical protein